MLAPAKSSSRLVSLSRPASVAMLLLSHNKCMSDVRLLMGVRLVMWLWLTSRLKKENETIIRTAAINEGVTDIEPS